MLHVKTKIMILGHTLLAQTVSFGRLDVKDILTQGVWKENIILLGVLSHSS